MGLLDPQLPHHRERFVRYRRRQFWGVVLVCLLISVFEPAVAIWGLPDSVGVVGIYVWLVLLSAVIGFFEIQRLRVFFADRRERESLSQLGRPADEPDAD